MLRRIRRTLGLLRRLSPAARRVAISRLLETRASRTQRLRSALATRPDTLLFICHGNIMRSAFAAAWVNQQYPNLGMRVIGAGTNATRGRPAQEVAQRVAAQMGTPLDGHSATPLSESEPGSSALLVCMDRANEANTATLWPNYASRVFLIGDIDELGMTDSALGEPNERWVADPYAMGDEVTKAAFERIKRLATVWADALRRA